MPVAMPTLFKQRRGTRMKGHGSAYSACLEGTLTPSQQIVPVLCSVPPKLESLCWWQLSACVMDISRQFGG